MRPSNPITASALLASIVVANPIQGRNASIQWMPCNVGNATVPVFCGNLSVPLDYTSPGSANLTLKLVKVPAENTPCKGSILLNFGGPGFTTVNTTGSLAEVLMRKTGGYHDLIGFDPRGTGDTLTFDCFGDQATRESYNRLNPSFANASDVAIGTMWAYSELLAEQCLQTQSKNGELIGTAFVARDMMQIVDALGEDGKLRYWGLSYGTTLGATVAAMFPDRIDRMILDGVQNPHEYFYGFDLEQLVDADKVFSSFFTGCVDNPSECALAASNPNATAAELEERVYDFIYYLKYNPVLIGNFLLDYRTVKFFVLPFMYDPKIWPVLGYGLNALLTNNATSLLSFAEGMSGSEVNPPGEGLRGIQCGDKAFRSDNLDDIRPAVERSMAISRILGDIPPGLEMDCARWKIHAKERYTGDFHVKTLNPVLFIGNTYDALTPLASARNVSTTFERSVVLEQHGWGHASLAQPSNCTEKVIQNYFTQGELPKPGTICEVDINLFQPV